MLRYDWSQRHTWQSWRERYKKNFEKFDRLIEEYLEKNPRHPQGKGEYQLKRKGFVVEESEESEEEDRKVSPQQTKRRRASPLSPSTSERVRQPTGENFEAARMLSNDSDARNARGHKVKPEAYVLLLSLLSSKLINASPQTRDSNRY